MIKRLAIAAATAVLLLTATACDSDKGVRCQGPAKAQVCTPYDKET